MRKLALQIEHKYRNRVVGVHLVENGKSFTTVGSAKAADIRVLGDDVAGFHAAFECQEGDWYLADLGSESGTWVNKKHIIECKIDGATVIHIGAHQLKATPHVLDRDLFAKPLDESLHGTTFHQVVVLKHGLLQESLLLAKNESYQPSIEGFDHLSAPQGYDWVTHEHGPYTIKQRLAKSEQMATSMGRTLGEDVMRPVPILAALLVLFLVFGMMFLLPQKPDDQMKTLTPELQNQYTRLIFDGQKVRSKKAIAEKLRKNMTGQTADATPQPTNGGDAGSKVANTNSKTPTGARVLVSLKSAGLGALIGRVAARASKNAQLVEAAGVAANSTHAGRAFGVGGGTALDKVGNGAATGQTLHVGGLGTAGKGGGSTGYKGTGTLSQGNVGNAEVGAIEEDSEVEGGLDKEAIARVIRSQLGQIRYCYERQLSANPDLYGKILVKFTIGAAGSVVAQTIGNTSLNNAMVEGCILRRIAGWQFPTPKGGTNVLVTYPFLFKSTR
jgi:hypothetical protein